ncbi:MAG: hypothetical protein ACI3V4_13015 [Faecousia sp.]
MSYNQKEYVESDAVKQARSALEQKTANKPGEYQSQWQPQLNDTIDKILNRKDFSYDINGDALYQQYKDRYTQQGKMAMMDTMGQAAAMTGGYGNSYAQIAGQQTYQNYLQGLNDKIPELYQLALDKYNQEGKDLYNQYSMLGAQEQLDYGRYQDAMNAWNQERSWLSDQYNTERSYDYGQYRDQVGDDQWDAEYDQQSWENAFRLYQLGVKTPEVLAILGIPEEDVGGESSGKSSGSGNGKVNLISEATKVAQQMGTGDAIRYIQDQTGGTKSSESVMAQANAKGVSQTERYKNMLAAQGKK